MARNSVSESSVLTFTVDIPESDLMAFWDACQFHSVQCSRAMFAHTDPLQPDVSLVAVTVQVRSPEYAYILGETFCINKTSRSKK